MIHRSRLFAEDLVAPHSPCKVSSKSGKGRAAPRLITMLEISNHERRSTRQGNFEGKRKLLISDSVRHAPMRTKKERVGKWGIRWSTMEKEKLEKHAAICGPSADPASIAAYCRN